MLLILILANQVIFFILLVVPSDAHPKIVGGDSISIDKAPYQVWIAFRVVHESKFGEGLFCGGTLISQNAVLTAAHCFYMTLYPNRNLDPDKFIIVAGCSNLIRPEKYTQELLVDKIIPHEQYDSSTISNDIAIVFLKGYIPLNSNSVQAIAVATSPPTENERCQISGWGTTIPDIDVQSIDEGFPIDLHQAEIPIRNYQKCKDIYPLFTSSQLCAGYKDGLVDTCYGDSGGPLVCSNKLSGITSFGCGCAVPDVPGVYTDVSYFRYWIEKVIKTYGAENSALYSQKLNITLILLLLMLTSL